MPGGYGAQCRSQRGGGQGWQCPHHEFLLPLSPRQFSKLSKSRRSVRENAMVFSNMGILISKAFTSDHLSHVLISIFIVFLLRTDRILCVCVCMCVQCINSTNIHLYMYHTSICMFLHVASPQSKGINRVFEYINYRTTCSCKREKLKVSSLVQLVTNTHNVHRNTGGRDSPHNPRGKALECSVTGIPANAFTININSTN